MIEDDLAIQGRRFVQKWAPRLHLLDWQIKLAVGPVDDHNSADVSVAWRDRVALITLGPDLVAKTRADVPYYRDVPIEDIIEQTVVHELLHILEYPIARQFEADLEQWIGTAGVATRETWEHWHDSREWWINAVARVLADADRGAWTNDEP